MSKSKKNNSNNNLTENKDFGKENKNRDYKAEYNRLLPTMSSSSNVLILYTLYLLNNSSSPLYGKEMLDKVKDDIGTDSWMPSHGTHYPVLKKMVKEGLISKVKSDNNKNYYTITEVGIKELKSKIHEFQAILNDNYKILSILKRICN